MKSDDLKNSWNSPEGYWKVTTESDCEGRSMRTLGFFKGHYADIAFALADRCAYSLHFTRIYDEEVIPVCRNNKKSVNITFDDGYHMDRKVLAQEVKTIVGEKYIVTNDGPGQIKLYKPDAEELVRYKALEKAKKLLSPDELSALGINYWLDT